MTAATLAPGPALAPASDFFVPALLRRLDPSWGEVGILAVFAFLGGLGLVAGVLVEFFNVVLPLVMVAVAGFGIVRMLRLDPANLWTTLLWMRGAVALYFGFGSLVPLFINAEARTYIETLFLFFPLDILKFNVVVTVFVTLVLATAALGERAVLARRSAGAQPFFRPRPSALSLTNIGLLFLLVGSLFNFGILLPQSLGLTTISLPNALTEIGMLAYVGLFFLTYSAISARSWLIVPVLAVGVVYIVFGLIQFSKTAVLYPVILIGIGYIYGNPTLRKLALTGFAVALTYFLSNSVVQEGRILMLERYDSLQGAGLQERLDIMRNSSLGRGTRVAGEINYGLTRLSYTNVGTYVISEQDQGIPGNSTANALATVVPRFIWPDKPVITDVARELSFQASGIYDNNIAPTLPGDAYWNGGWPGLVLWAVVIGLIFWIWSCYAIAVLRAEAWHLFAVVLIGARLGLRLDGFLIIDLIGPIPIAVVGHVLLSAINGVIAQR